MLLVIDILVSRNKSLLVIQFICLNFFLESNKEHALLVERSKDVGQVTIEHLSEKFHINPTTMKKVFRDVYGNSIAAHIKEHRMEHAARLLLETSDGISDIAYQVGYRSQSKFTASFRKQFGMLPNEYRRFSVPDISLPLPESKE